VRWQVGAAGLRLASDEGWQARLSSRRFGREGALIELAAPTVQIEANDARLVRAGLVERWVHGPLGVEHLFEVATRPAGAGALLIELEVEGLSPALAGEAVTLSDESGVRARYAELWVEDADGEVVPAQLEVVAGVVRIRVDDAHARYPLVIDPLAGIEQARLEASDGAAGDLFGAAVAVDGDTALVGAWADNTAQGENAGSVYVFVRSGTSWTEQARLEASDGAADDFFGGSVALSGDTALVGSLSDTARGENAGSAYVYVRSGTSWTEQAKLEASDGAADDWFGASSVALSGDTALVGASRDDTERGEDAGSAYVFVRSGTSWTEDAKLEARDGAGADFFGSSVALSGDTALVGAAGGDTAGSAYVFVRSGTSWTEQATLRASDGAAGFGLRVALSGDTALVGAHLDDTARGRGAGSAYVFVRSGTSWTEEAKLEASDGAPNEFFGLRVALSGDTALVAGTSVDIMTWEPVDEGWAYVFVRNGTTWTQEARLRPSDGEVGDFFGASVAVDGDTVLVGAARGDTPRGDNAGSAYVLVLGCPAGMFSADGTRASCTRCPAGTWSSAGATSCSPWSECASGTYGSRAATSVSNRMCTACTVCTAGEVRPCTATADAVCASIADGGVPRTDAGDGAVVARGCGCAAAGADGEGSRAALGLLGLLALVLRRRARCRPRA
jgi:MYXO-CTERM domain-containing protein